MVKKNKKYNIDLENLNKKVIREVDISGEKVKICSVNGTYIRDNFYQDFTQGGHHWVSENYEFIPDGEIFIDEVLNEKDREATIIHEVKEYGLMKYKGMKYDPAHEKSNKVEENFRKQYDTKTVSANRSKNTKETATSFLRGSETTSIINEDPTAAEEAQEHEETFEKIQKGEIDTAEELGESIEEDHEAKEIKELYDQKLTPSNGIQVNEALKARKLSEGQRDVLYNWEGEGAVKHGESKTGILHEFFTPYWLCKALANIIKDLGIKTNKVLDPAIGTARLVRYLDAKQIIGFEVNKLNADISQKLYPKAKIYNQAFETAFLKEPRYTSATKISWLGHDFDLVISNPPYGEYAGEYAGYMPKLFTRFEMLFMFQSMSLVKSGGYGVFILPQSFMNNGNMYNKQKSEIMKYSKFIDAVRLPNGIFASTDIGVDVLILQKK
jgi:type I restriction-modification system DNA methylase subunit